MPAHPTIRLTREQLALVLEALDSHVYWQLSDERYRDSGFVYGKGSDDPDAKNESPRALGLDPPPASGLE